MAKLLDSRFVTGPNEDLATVDVYEVTDKVLSTRNFNTEQQALAEAIVSATRRPGALPDQVVAQFQQLGQNQLHQIQQQIAGQIQQRAQALMDQLPESVRAALSQVKVSQATQLRLQSLGMIWDQGEDSETVDPERREIVGGLLALLQIQQDQQIEISEDVGPLVDVAAHTLLGIQSITQAIKQGPSAIVDQQMQHLPSDRARQVVAEETFDQALNPDNEAQPTDPVAQTETRLHAPEQDIADRFNPPPQPKASGNVPLPDNPGRGYDIRVIRELLRHTTAERLRARVPDIGRKLLAFYRRDSTQPAQAAYDELAGVLNQLIPDWQRAQRGGQTIGRLDYLAYASQDAYQLLYRQGNPLTAVGVMVGRRYRHPTSIQTLVRRQYPSIGI